MTDFYFTDMKTNFLTIYRMISPNGVAAFLRGQLFRISQNSDMAHNPLGKIDGF